MGASPSLPDRFLPRFLDALVHGASSPVPAGVQAPDAASTSAVVRRAADDAAALEILFAVLDPASRDRMLAAHLLRALGPGRTEAPDPRPTWREALDLGGDGPPGSASRIGVLVVDPGGDAVTELRTAADVIRSDRPRLAVGLETADDWLVVPALVLELVPGYAIGLAAGDDPATTFLVARIPA